MDKIFNIDNIQINIPEELYEKAKQHFIIDDNIIFLNAYFKNCIRSQYCKDFNDLEKYSFENICKKLSNNEISLLVQNAIKKDISESV